MLLFKKLTLTLKYIMFVCNYGYKKYYINIYVIYMTSHKFITSKSIKYNKNFILIIFY